MKRLSLNKGGNLKTRADNKGGRIRIDRDRCKGCGYCIIACRPNCISINEVMNTAGYFPALFYNSSRCTGCASCAKMCPEIAIEVWRS